ncbi:glycosyltransferase family 4 protein [Tengunoibacter tsumagoiensis]|uniref:Glycosyl transferase family 1 domain-containing protein n=1 Tax=Tengunoibacter tsumagoiensis TaxID=2014871 RepID=A0A402A7E2_9CHLR|nr:glycosyltransferase family 4 protein [Tengunoibacter tsumagoiensis]GCE14959.1 hypothetical protein KTT_48180 [Tengunoibacter tsumagoiensis]
MKIAAFSMGPIFPQFVHGGSQRTLRTILMHLGKEKHDVTLYCTRRDDNNTDFQLAPNVWVRPILRFKQTYPETYYTPPYNLANVIGTLAEAIDTHDAFYIHDSELAFHFLYTNIPTVVSFRDFVYPDTLASAFSFRRDHLVLNSSYLNNCVESIFSTFRDIRSQTSIIPNGFQMDLFQRRDSQQLRSRLKLSDDAIPVLYPHRPDPKKGLYESMDVLARARAYIPAALFRRIKLLIPRWIDSNVVEEGSYVFQNIYKDILDYAHQRDIADLIHIHPWIGVEDMPAYYSLGRATLCIGNFIESFGNSSIESELCGTPALISRVAAQRSILPEEISFKVDYQDIEGAAFLLGKILCEGASHTREIREYINTHNNEKDMVRRYAQTLEQTTVISPIMESYRYTWNEDDLIKIPAWCSNTKSGYYNDYSYGYSTDQELLSIVQQLEHPCTLGSLQQHGISEGSILEWVEKGFLVRIPYER